MRSTLSFGMQGVENEIENSEFVVRHFPGPGDFTLGTGATRQSDLDHRVDEGGLTRQAPPVLDHRGTGILGQIDHDPGLRHHGHARAQRVVQQMHRPGQFNPARHDHRRAVGQRRLIECGKAIGIIACDPAQHRLDALGISGNRVGQTRHPDALGQIAHSRQIG